MRAARDLIATCAMWLLLAPAVARAVTAEASVHGPRLDVPVIRQARERCGEAALEMVLRYYGADSAALAHLGLAYDPVLHGSLITDLATAARNAGFVARIATLTPDSLVALLQRGVPPIVLYQAGRPPLTSRHFGVVVGWEPAQSRFTLNDGTSLPRTSARNDLAARWERAGSQALIVSRP